MAKIDEIDRPTDAAFLLLYFTEEIEGITKIQKLLFLMEEESEFGKEFEDKISFDFIPYKMGPFSPKVYEEIELLLNIGAVEKEEMERSATDSYEVSNYTEEEGSEGLAGKRFSITPKGKKIAEDLAEILDEDQAKELNDLFTKYNQMPLMQVLEYVYTEYPEMTDNSEIKEEVLG